MAIGGSKNLTGYAIGGKPLGVQLGQKSGTELFGDNVSASSLFAANLTSSSAITIDATQIAVKGLQDQIDRIQGYRTNLSVAEKQQLAKHQEKITNINQLASTRILTPDELAERGQAYVDSYRILGKEYEDFTNDAFVNAKSDALAELIATKPRGAEAERLERLEGILVNLKRSATEREGEPPTSLVTQTLSVNKQIAQLTKPRPISSLSPEELRQHDKLVDEINEHVGFELELSSDKKLQIERLQKTIQAIQEGSGSGGGLFA